MTSPALSTNIETPSKSSLQIKYLKDFQTRFVLSEKRYLAFVGAWGTGKDMCCIARGMRLSREHPGNLGLIARAEFTDLQDSTINDFQDYTGVKVDSHRNAVLAKGSKVMFRHLEELTESNLNNMNLGWFCIIQAEEIKTDSVFFKLNGRLRRCHGCGFDPLKGQECHCQQSGFVSANADGHNWIWKLFNRGDIGDHEYIEAKTADNADVLPKPFMDSLEVVKKNSPKTYNRLVLNSHEDEDTLDVIIQSIWVKRCRDMIATSSAGLVRRIVSIDVARGGLDKSTFYALENHKVLGKEEHNTHNTMELVGLAQVFANRWDIKAYAVDEIGVGAGVADRLKELGKEVIFVNAAQRDNVPSPYFNRRSEILGFGAQLFERTDVWFPPTSEYDGLAEQLSWTKWKPMRSTGILQAESKDDVRKEYGRSPDDADAFLNGLWAIQKIHSLVGVGRDRNSFNGAWIPPRYRNQESLQRRQVLV